MEELKLTPSELKRIIDDSKMIGSGFFGTTFEYNGDLIKLDKNLYSLLRANDPVFADQVFADRYKWDKDHFANPEQIATLASKQKDITLTRLPQGIVRVEGIIPGIIIPYHRDHQGLEKLPPNDYKKLLIILRKLLLAVRELADNQISQEDLSHYPNRWSKKKEYNVLYQGDTPQIIDLSGEFIKCGEYFTDAMEMYRSLGDVVLDYFSANGLPTDVKFEDVTDEGKVRDLINELEDRVKGK